ncbi:unnamed protein product [Parajaminaea phylloscopi]
MIYAVSSFPIICWAYLVASLWLPEATVIAPLTRWLPVVLSQGLHRFIGLPWALLEALFSVWHAYQVRRLQRPGPKPLYSRRFLDRVFSRALRSGLEDHPTTHMDRRDEDEVTASFQSAAQSSNGLGNGIRYRKNHSSNGFSVATTRQEGEDPELWFKRHNLAANDPRAVKFQQDQARWFSVEEGQDAKTEITRRDASIWLAWSLFNCPLEELEEEHRLLHSAPSEAGLERRTRQLEESLANKYSTLRDPVNDDDDEDPDLKKVLASPSEWANAADQGTRLDYVRKARRIIEARQGFAYPLSRNGGSPDLAEVDGEGHQEGHPVTQSMRLTLDPVKVQARPLLMYCVTQGLSYLTLLLATTRGGFRLEREGRLSYLVKVPRGWTPAAAADAANKGRYRPIVFLHGLGIGLAQYSSLVHSLAHSKLAETHPLMIPLQPHTAQNVFSKHFLHPLGHHEMIRCLRKAMRKLQWDDCGIQVVSHSMGTIVHSWLLKSLGTKVRRSCFVDPVCVRLWIPDVAGNFVYLTPSTPVALLMRYFVGNELGTANALCRHFDWASALLWPEDEIPNVTSRHHTTFFLAGQDAILSCKETREYLLEHGVQEVQLADAKTGSRKRRGGLVVDWQAAHGELLMKDGPGLAEVMSWLEEEDI